MKKRIIALITTVSFIALLCGCDKGDSQYSDVSDVISSTGGDTPIGTSDGELVFADFVGEYPENPLTIMTLSEDEIRQVINAQPNFQCSENMYINIPESASVYEYKTYGVHVPQFDYPAEQYKKDYEESFKYFSPTG